MEALFNPGANEEAETQPRWVPPSYINGKKTRTENFSESRKPKSKSKTKKQQSVNWNNKNQIYHLNMTPAEKLVTQFKETNSVNQAKQS